MTVLKFAGLVLALVTALVVGVMVLREWDPVALVGTRIEELTQRVGGR